MDQVASEFLAQLADPEARGLALLVMLLVLAAALILALMLARWGRRLVFRDSKPKRTHYVDAWHEAGRRAGSKPETRKDDGDEPER